MRNVEVIFIGGPKHGERVVVPQSQRYWSGYVLHDTPPIGAVKGEYVETRPESFEYGREVFGVNFHGAAIVIDAFVEYGQKPADAEVLHAVLLAHGIGRKQEKRTYDLEAVR